jgi:hypothetical protein
MLYMALPSSATATLGSCAWQGLPQKNLTAKNTPDFASIISTGQQ